MGLQGCKHSLTCALEVRVLTVSTLYFSKHVNIHVMPQNKSQEIPFLLSDSSDKTEVKSNAKS